VPHPDVLAQRVLVRPNLLRHFGADDRDGKSVRSILPGEDATSLERNAQGGKETGRHDLRDRRWGLARSRWRLAFRGELDPVPVPSRRQTRNGGGRVDAGQSSNVPQDPVVVASNAIPAVISMFREGNMKGEHMPAVKAHAARHQGLEAFHHGASSDQ